jgi:hypothetical protein
LGCGHVDALAGLDRLEAQALGDGQPVRQPVHHVDPLRARGLRDLRRDQAHRPGPEHHNRRPDVLLLGECERVDADGTHLPEIHAVVPRQVLEPPHRRT